MNEKEEETTMVGNDQGTGAVIVHRLHRAFNDRDRDAFLGCLAEDVRWHVGGSSPLAGTYEGRDGLWERFMEPMWASPARMEDHEVLEHGEHVVALGVAIHNFGEGERGWETVEVFKLDGGRVVERWELVSHQAELDRLLTRGCPAEAGVDAGTSQSAGGVVAGG